MALNSAQRRYLKQHAHHLNPVATVGHEGLAEGVIREIARGLDHHGLVKVKLRVDDRAALGQLESEIIDQTGAEHVQTIGRLVVIYRALEKSKIRLPRSLRI